MVMDLCDGTLVDVLDAAQGTLPDKAILKIIADVCTALAHMHGQDPPIAHRWESVCANQQKQQLLQPSTTQT